MPRTIKGTATHVPSEKEKANLRTFDKMSPEEKRAIQSKGGKASAEKRRYNESFKMAVEWALTLPAMKGNPTVEKIRKAYPKLNNRDAMAISMVAEAIKKGNVKAFEALRDTAGESPKKSVDLGGEALTINIKTVE